MANLCVLTYYLSDDFCNEMISLVNDENDYANMFYSNDGYKKGYPWLFYLTNSRASGEDSILYPEIPKL